MAFRSSAIDLSPPMVRHHPERYVLKRLTPDPPTSTDTYLGLDPTDQGVRDVEGLEGAHRFLTHEAALRAAAELNRLGRGPLDVVKVGDP